MNTKDQLICTWSGLVFLLLFFVGWGLLSGFILPPHSPTMTAAEVGAFYQENPVSIRLGLVIALLACAFYVPFGAVITVQMARIEGRYPVWTITQAMATAGTVIEFAIPTMFWQVASFRPDRHPDVLLALNDLSWLPFVGISAPYFIVPITIAIVGFRDKSAQPMFPRWACYYNLLTASAILPGCVVVLFKSGPMAWNGLISWWLPVIDYGIWFIVMTVLLTKGIKRQAQEEQVKLHGAKN